MKGVCVFAGSFDPPHLGHMDVIGKCNLMFDKVVVAIGVNDKKTYTYPLNKRLEMLKAACARYDSVEVTSFDGYLADFIRSVGTTYYVRGIRDDKDVKYETDCFAFNASLNPDIQTLLVPCSKDVKNISSTRIKQLMKEGKSVSALVPYEIIPLL
ncbi:MAG: pantetheine-phosphate adenylyltransferase [Clostridia bacterium]|nr:pantetheine-phosphate adenylyltransferase [Clostridia bacterium]